MGKLEYTPAGLDFITARNKVMFSPVCVKNIVQGGHAWQKGACMAEQGMHDRGCA